MTISQWCTAHKDTIAAIGFFVTAIGLGATVYQISTARNVLQATNAYQIQKDARELAGHLIEDDLEPKGQPGIKMSDYILAETPEKFKVYDDAASNRMARIFNFYLSVYRQYMNDGVAPSFAKAFSVDFCDLFKKPGVNRYWESRVKSPRPPSMEMREMKNAWCP